MGSKSAETIAQVNALAYKTEISLLHFTILRITEKSARAYAQVLDALPLREYLVLLAGGVWGYHGILVTYFAVILTRLVGLDHFGASVFNYGRVENHRRFVQLHKLVSHGHFGLLVVRRSHCDRARYPRSVMTSPRGSAVAAFPQPDFYVERRRLLVLQMAHYLSVYNYYILYNNTYLRV